MVASVIPSRPPVPVPVRSIGAPRVHPVRSSPSCPRALRRDSWLPAVLAGCLLLLASVAAPDQPQDQEAICQRQNGVDACRVW